MNAVSTKLIYVGAPRGSSAADRASFLEGTGGTGLHALQIQHVDHEAAIAVHDPEVANMHARQELKRPKVIGYEHALVHRVPAASGATAREVDLTADGWGIGPLALYNGFIDFTHLIVSERLFEKPLAVEGNIWNGPGINRVEVGKPN